DKENYEELFVVDVNGKGILKNKTEIDISNRDYFLESLNGHTIMGEINQSLYDNNKKIMISTPIYMDGEVVKVLVGAKSTNQFNEIFGMSFQNKGYAFAVNTKGEIIATTDIGITEKYHNILTLFKKTAHNYEKLKDESSVGINGHFDSLINDEELHVHFEPIGFNDWYIFSIVPKVELTKQSNDILQGTHLFLGLITGMFIIYFFSMIKMNTNYLKELKRIAFVDPVTGWSNFNKFKLLGNRVIKDNKDKQLVCVHIDVEDFTLINDLYGFIEGDEVLKSMNEAIRIVIDKGDLFARNHGDEFFIITSYTKEEDLERRDKAFKNYFDKLQNVRGMTYSVKFRTGIYKIDSNEVDIVKIIEKTSMAHKIAKNTSCNDMIMYDDTIREKAIIKKNIEDNMDKALEDKEFIVYLQPKYDLNTNKMMGAEALVRWKKSSGQLIPPNQFIPIFEQNGFVMKIDLFVLEEVCKLQRHYLDQGLNPVTISVNQSRLLIDTSDYVDKVYAIVKKYGIPPRLIELEITETIFQNDIEKIIETVKELREIGFSVSIDDFGSGYSSLNMLKDVEVNILKIDRNFLNRTEDSERGIVIIESIIKLARQLGMRVVTEGIETQIQADMLRELGCDFAQGYHYAKPMPIAEFDELIK
ncbi:MAG: bifunctional diguanylate cyclase/phosphodiesterase, partial [Turicibacter sp.]